MKVAVAGLGWWGKQIIRSLAASPKFEVVSGVDPVPPGDAAAFAADHRITIETDLATVLASPAIEGVILATPHLLHEEQVLAAVAGGKHVFCEKPLTMTGAGAQKMVDACTKAGTVLGIGHERRWEPAFEELGRLIRTGALGVIQHFEANVSHDILRPLPPGSWRLDPIHAPAGLMTGVGIHLTDLFISFVGPASTVSAETARMIFQAPADDFVTARIRFKSGVHAVITGLSATPYYGRVTVFGDIGWAEVIAEANVDQGKPTVLIHSDGKVRNRHSYEATDTVRLNFEAWADAIAGNTPYRFTPEQLVENVRVFEAIVSSSNNGGTTVVL
ncbi:MAG TPA: Gfo/Idh/MocA family oxidoreductase [Magnetospirillaceae bacterium]|jgi:predicted dehydrogenase